VGARRPRGTNSCAVRFVAWAHRLAKLVAQKLLRVRVLLPHVSDLIFELPPPLRGAALRRRIQVHARCTPQSRTDSSTRGGHSPQSRHCAPKRTRATPCLQQPLVVLLQSIREWLEVCDLRVCCRRLHARVLAGAAVCDAVHLSRCTPAHARRGAEASRAARAVSAWLHLLPELLLKPSVAVADRSVALSQLLVQLGKIVCRMHVKR
jgi:hypothetical protein